MLVMAAAVNYLRLKLLCILEGSGEDVLCHALLCGTGKTASVTLLNHLDNLPPCSTANYRALTDGKKKKLFTVTEKNRISTDASCKTFDITLLYKCIQHACENVRKLNEDWKDKTQMEGLITNIKDERNACVHERHQMTDEQQFKAKAGELKTLFTTVLQAIKHKYNVPDDETDRVTDKVVKHIDDVLEAFTDSAIVNMNFQKKLNLFKQETVAHLKHNYKRYENISPLSFLCGSQERFEIQRIFVKLSLKQQQQQQQQPSTINMDVLDILKPLTEECASDSRPRLAVVSGVAGSGKTTLLTFILSDWVKDDHGPRVAHLEEYDIVLRVQCRNRDATDLEAFLRLALPASLQVLNEPLTGYMQCSKALFLIDGIDEMNTTSEELVNSILVAGKYTQWSVLATTRPERVDQLLARAGPDYRHCQIFVEGIPVDRRVEFALRYAAASTSQDRLRQIITEQEDNELFELPLNLLFLIILFEDNPDYMEEPISQSSLFTHIHEWCTEKLRIRISTYPTWGDRRPATLKTRIKRAVSELYRTALHCLLQDTLTISEQDTEQLAECCEEEDLPAHDVLGAFLTLRLSSTDRVRHHHYCLPHKSMMEYYAAKHIVQRLQAVSPPGPGAVLSLLQAAAHPPTKRPRLQDASPPRPGAVLSLLQAAAHPPARLLDLRGLRNLFLHLAALVATEQVPDHQATVEEVIELVGKTGAGWGVWLSLVEHTQKKECFLQPIARHVTQNTPNSSAVIRDSTLANAAALLPLLPPTTVELYLDNERVNVDNVRALTRHRCHNLHLDQHYQHPGDTPASDSVLRATNRCGLESFFGHLSGGGVALLYESIRELRLAVGSDEQATSVPAALVQQATALPHLLDLGIHVAMAMVTPAVAPSQLPAVRNSFWGTSGVRLVLSGVDKGLMREACRVAAALQAEPGYQRIGFPGCRMEAAEWRELMHLLHAVQVRVKDSVLIPVEAITEDDETELSQLTHTLLGCTVIRTTDSWCF